MKGTGAFNSHDRGERINIIVLLKSPFMKTRHSLPIFVTRLRILNVRVRTFVTHIVPLSNRADIIAVIIKFPFLVTYMRKVFSQV